MADAAPAAPAEEQGSVAATIFRSLVIYFIFSSFIGRQTPQTEQASQQASRSGQAPASQDAPQLPPFTNLARLGQEFNLWVYLSASDDEWAEEDLVWQEESIYYDWKDINVRAKNVTLPLAGKWATLQQNGSIFAHVYFTWPEIRPGMERSDGSMDFRMVHGVQQLNRYAPRPKVKDAKNLLGYTEGQEGSSGDSAAAEGLEEAGQPEGGEGGEGVVVATTEDGADIVSLWKSKLTLNLVVDHTVYPRNGVPEQVATTMRFHPAKSKYHPKLFFNDFWTLREEQVLLNSTVDTVTLQMDYYPLSLWKWQLIEQMETNWKSQREMGTGGGETETEILKNMLTETSPQL